MFPIYFTPLATLIVLWLLNSVVSSQQQTSIILLQKCSSFIDSRHIQNGGNSITIPFSRTSQAGYPSSETSKDPLTFEFDQKSDLKCPYEKSLEIQLLWNLTESEVLDLEPRNFNDVATGSTEKHQHSHFTHSGYFYDAQSGNYYTSDGGYCVSRISDNGIDLHICNASSDCTFTTSLNTYCLPKCCALDEILSLWDNQCVRLNKTESITSWQPPIFEGAKNPQKEINPWPNIIYHMAELPKNCSPITYFEENEIVDRGYRDLLASDVNHFNDSRLSRFRDNVKLILPGKNKGRIQFMQFYEASRKWKVEHIHNYCVEQFYVNSESDSGFQGNPNNFLVLYCPNEEVKECEGSEHHEFIISWVYVAISVLALLFLLSTLIVYAVLWDKHNFHGVTIASYTFSTFGCYFFLMIAHIISLYPDDEWTGLHDRGPFCYKVGTLAHYFYLSSLLWLTAMNFDLWITFKTMRAVRHNTKEWSKYGAYSLVTWLLPGMLVASFVVIDHVYRDPFTEVPVPEYAMGACFVSPEFRGQYVYIPMAILLMINILLIMMTMWIFIKTRIHTSKMLSKGNTTNANRYSVSLFGKLFIIMGGTSVVEFLTWYYNNECYKPWYIVVLEVMENVSPVLLFFLFCLNEKVIKQMKEKYPVFTAKILRLFKKNQEETAAEHSTGSTGRSLVSLKGMKTNIEAQNVNMTL